MSVTGLRTDRDLIATRSGVASVTRVYSAPDALEVDEAEGVDVTRRRILFEDVLAITRHRERGAAYIVTTAFLGFGFTGLAGLVALGDERTGALVIFTCFALPFLIALVWRAAFGLDVITVFGRRSKVALRFSPVRGRAPGVYGRLCRLVRGAQRRPAPAAPADASET